MAGFQLPFFKEQENTKVFLEQKDAVVIDFPQVAVSQNSFRQAGPTSLIKAEALGSMALALTAENNLIERKESFEYLVEPGETLSSIAEKFEVSLNTILWANDLTKGSKIMPGEKLVILPVSGIMHAVEKGETLSYLAKVYKTDSQAIIDFNEINSEDEIFIGDLLIIPNGKMPAQRPTYSTPLASAYFIKPVLADFQITQGLHYYNAIDFGNGKCGSPVFASAGGTVQKTGFHYTAGNYVRIIHPNDVVTFYGHLSAILALSGQQVSQGELIGYIGNTGYTVGATGCHLHFEVRGAKNPFAH